MKTLLIVHWYAFLNDGIFLSQRGRDAVSSNVQIDLQTLVAQVIIAADKLFWPDYDRDYDSRRFLLSNAPSRALLRTVNDS